MSLDIELYDKEDNELHEMNWLRNPFGLQQWAEHNVGDKIPKVISGTVNREECTIDFNKEKTWNLWDVTNEFCYKRSKLLNEGNIETRKTLRYLFKTVVDLYWAEIEKLEVGYFYFNLPNYRQFVEGKKFHTNHKGVGYTKDHNYFKISIEIYNSTEPIKERVDLEGYKRWFKELVDFAEDLQDLTTTFSGSN